MTPRATYRVQVNAGFDFAAAESIVSYLAELGVSHLYTSPILKARPGSLHGYDVIDPTQLNPEIGDDAAFASLHAELQAHGMQLLLDIVPNHMGVLGAENPWWMDVLENGPAARNAVAFDIEWTPPQHELHGKLLLAVLGNPYGQVLEAGEIEPVFDAARGGFALRYYDHRFPIDPACYPAMLRAVPVPEAADADQRAQIDSLLDGLARLPARAGAGAVERATRQREAAGLKRALRYLHAGSPWARDWLDACAASLRGTPGDPGSFDALDTLIGAQAYRLAYWRAAGDEINYRRFFDINGLAALRMEDPVVFEAAHLRIFEWVDAQRVDGLRIDHPDGMTDPARYFDMLRARCPDAYLVAEKILADDEPWTRDWPLQGETGYRFANQAVGVLVDTGAEPAFDALYAAFVGAPVDFDAELAAAKRSIMHVSLAADLRLLTELAHDLALGGRASRDLTRDGLTAAIVAFVSAFDVYRSYVSERGVAPADVARIEKCAAAARAASRPSLLPYLDFLKSTLLDANRTPQTLRFVQRLQQFTAPVMAKAMEDTAFYRHHRLVALNDVGGDPRRFGLTVAGFHTANAARRRDCPQTMLATSTHDSKRSADVRARLAVLSEMPEDWWETLQRWRALAETQWRIGSLATLPAANDLMLLFQTLVGVWPADLADDAQLADVRRRVGEYMLKAVREAKQRSSWLDTDDGYEAALQQAVDVLLARLEPNPFLTDLRRVVTGIATFGCVNSLALVVLKLTSPGVPDVYQGTEDWKYALVDPDNRQPVDFDALRARLAAALAPGAVVGMPPCGGLQKLLVSARLLHWRRDAAEALLRDGDYTALELRGEHAAHAVAYQRCLGEQRAIVVVPRLTFQVSGGSVQALLDGSCWGDTALLLAPGDAVAGWRNVVSGRHHGADGGALPLSALLGGGLPLAVLSPV